MDISMPDLNGIDATRQIIAQLPNVKGLSLSMHSDKRFVASMFKAGVSGYLLKECSYTELIEAIRSIEAKKVFLSSKLTDLVVEDYINQLSESNVRKGKMPSLTNRETEIVKMICKGYRNKEIMQNLNISEQTVKMHLNHIYKKVKVSDRLKLALYAIKHWSDYLNET